VPGGNVVRDNVLILLKVQLFGSGDGLVLSNRWIPPCAVAVLLGCYRFGHKRPPFPSDYTKNQKESRRTSKFQPDRTPRIIPFIPRENAIDRRKPRSG
jgi:hypothetical protein